MKTPAPAGILCAHVIHLHPVGLVRTPSPRHAHIHPHWSPNWPRPGLRTPTDSPPPTPGLEGEVHPRELHQGPGREAARDGKDWAPLGTKVLDSHPAPAEGDGGQRKAISCPRREGEALEALGQEPGQWAGPSSCRYFPAGVCRGLRTLGCSPGPGEEEENVPKCGLNRGPWASSKKQCFSICPEACWAVLPLYAHSLPGSAPVVL